MSRLAPTLPSETAARPAEEGATVAGLPSEPPGTAPAAPGARYEVLGLLGRGGMGDVYRARDRTLGRPVALKFLRGADPERAMRFLREARAQARIDHPNVCKVFDAGETDGQAFIAMQLVEGERMDVAARGLAPLEKARWLKAAAEAVEAAHVLGVIHRDLKPSNIMVLPGEGARREPVIMDFGLAYEAGEGHGLTSTGAVMGTPAYMAPEQARGELDAIGARTDVYGLGATLYELLVGEPPFTGATPLETLNRVLHDDPVPPRERVPDLDADLETVCLKCLSKEPALRYASARALAEDLGRYLDGAPILGQRPRLTHRLRRAARRHRGVVFVSGVSLVGMLLLAGFGARAWLAERDLQARTASRVRLAEQLGQQVQEIEAFVRAFQGLPLHDTRPEQQRVRARMARMGALRPGLDGLGEGLVRQALGRGHLAMREFEQAHRELTRARELGVDSPGLHYALGRVLGEQYRLAVEDARRSGGAAWVAARRRQLEARYLAPALDSLERSGGVELESPRYLEGLIALYRKDYDGAERAARDAVAQASWMPEVRMLAGDVALARAMALLEQGDYAGARTGLMEAESRYQRTVELARSDAWAHEALAEVWLQLSELDKREGRSRKAALDQAEAAADRSLVADPDRASGHTKKAQVLMNQYRAVTFQGAPDARGAEALLEAWTDAASRAGTLEPRNVLAHDSLGYSYFMRGLRQARAGEAPEASWARAIQWLERAIELEPHYPWALNDLGLVHRWRGNYQREHGQDPLPAYAEAERAFQRAVQGDPKYLFAHSNLAELYAARAALLLSRGRDPEADVHAALEASAQALSLDERFHSAHDHAAAAELTRARYLLETGGDPRPALARALQATERSRGVNARSDRAWLHAAGAHLLEALQALRGAGDASAALASGQRALAEAYRLSPTCADCRSLGAELALAAAEQARRDGRSSAALLRKALTEARRAVSLYPYYDSHLTLARSAWRLARDTGAPSALVEEGLAQVDLALKLDPGLPEAHAVRGALLLLRARRQRPAVGWEASLHEADAAWRRATAQVPWLSRYVVPLDGAEQAALRAAGAPDSGL
ncbi:protein kinase domain-containing protein [Myxococcus sp. AM010]|uniref:protein kinase domain-containing protein n=1 Tax=Myxococcus sp. AM010 TaxID=2745138 RepID=UPI001595FED6|nr:protein kinase [Myxococcus sp. AM010]NVJ16239.1 protein kinase [Myxococcus sp. AM010]